jgi:hypothetical protein
MDTKTETAAMKSSEEIAAVIEVIKVHMPDTYKAIKLKADSIGKPAYEYVRRGIRGEPNCFYAFENFNVVGTKFSIEHEDALALATYMVEFGSTFCIIFGDRLKKAEVQHGTH